MGKEDLLQLSCKYHNYVKTLFK